MLPSHAVSMCGNHRFTLFLVAVLSLADTPCPAGATLTFQRPTDILGAASLFQEGSGLPTRNFTISTTVRSSSGTDRFILQRPGVGFYMHFYPATTGLLDVTVDSVTTIFDVSAKFSAEDAIMEMRTWTVTYSDTARQLSLFIDTVHIETKDIAPIYPGISIFGQGGISQFVTGPYCYDTVDEGEVTLSLLNDIEVRCRPHSTRPTRSAESRRVPSRATSRV